MAYQIKRVIPLKKGFDVLVDLGFRSKTLYFRDQKTFDLEFPARMAQAELNVQADLDQAAYDNQHPVYYTREEFETMLKDRNMIRDTQTLEDLPTKSTIWSNLTDMQSSEILAIWDKIFKTTLTEPKVVIEIK